MKLITFEDIQSSGIGPLQCMEWVENAIARKSEAILPAKISLHPGAEGAFCNFMPCIVPDARGELFGGVKMVTRYPKRVPALDSKILLFNAESGESLAFIDGDWITAMRTGAVAAHSVLLFAKKDFQNIGIIGLGNTGRAALLMLAEKISNRDLFVTVLAHNGQEAAFIERFNDYSNLHFDIVDSYEKLVSNSDVVISAVTYFPDDICPDSCFKEGVLVVPIHTRGFTNCDLFFDKVFADDTDHVKHFKNFSQFRSFAEVSDVVAGRAQGRVSESERILAYNIGIAMHDILFAANICKQLKKDDLTEIDLAQPELKTWV